MAEILRELRIWIQALDLSKYEVALAAVVFMLLWNIKPILDCWVQLRAVDRNFDVKKRKLENQIERERNRRSSKKKG